MQKTPLPKKQEIERKWYLIDAKDKVLGKISTVIADKIRGKDKAIFTPNMDCGDFVIVVNAEKVKLTGNKMSDKVYYTHSAYLGSLRSEKAEDLLKRKPEKIIEMAVKGMLPKNKLRKDFLSKLKIYIGENHPHQAQSPQLLEV